MRQEQPQQGDWSELIEVCRQLGPKREALEMGQGEQIVLDVGTDRRLIALAVYPYAAAAGERGTGRGGVFGRGVGWRVNGRRVAE